MLRYDHLVGRGFLPGVRDCFGIGRDLYRDNFGIEVTNYARPHDWSSDSVDLVRALHEEEGFQMITDWKVNDLRPADVLATAIGESNPNHLAYYVGDNTILHHVYGQLSKAEPYRDFWRSATCFILRHPDVPDLRPVRKNTDIGGLLRDRYRVETAD